MVKDPYAISIKRIAGYDDHVLHCPHCHRKQNFTVVMTGVTLLSVYIKRTCTECGSSYTYRIPIATFKEVAARYGE